MIKFDLPRALHNDILLYSVPSFYFHHFLSNILIFINTFEPKLYPFTRMKKIQIICLEMPPLQLQV